MDEVEGWMRKTRKARSGGRAEEKRRQKRKMVGICDAMKGGTDEAPVSFMELHNEFQLIMKLQRCSGSLSSLLRRFQLHQAAGVSENALKPTGQYLQLK